MSKTDARESLRKTFNIDRGRAKFATIRERIQEAARVDGIHLCQLIAAMVIACIGLNTDSTEAIIGAMLICPLMGSVVALACGVSTMDMRMVRQAVWGLAVQCGICLITSTLYFLVSPLAAHTSALLMNSSPTIWDVIIALVGGLAGALGLSRRQAPSTLLAGVAVATALMPPLCAVGYGVSELEWSLAGSALYEFIVNVVFIAFGATIVLVWLRMPLVGDLDGDGVEDEAERAEAERESRPLRRWLLVALLILAIPCVSYSLRLIRGQEHEEAMDQLLNAEDAKQLIRELGAVCPGFVRLDLKMSDADDPQVVATVVTNKQLSEEDCDDTEALVRIHADDVDEVTFDVTR